MAGPTEEEQEEMRAISAITDTIIKGLDDEFRELRRRIDAQAAELGELRLAIKRLCEIVHEEWDGTQMTTQQTFEPEY